MGWIKSSSCACLVVSAQLAVASSAYAEASANSPTSIILDTDMWGDIDDVLALAGLHALQDRGEAKILAITCVTSDPWCPSYVDLVDTFYGHPGILIGLVRNGVAPPARWSGDGNPMAAGAPMYTEYFSNLRKPDRSWVFPHTVRNGDKAPDSVVLLRKTLAAQPDLSVVMVGVGFATNFARLLESKPDQSSPLDGRALIQRKVSLLTLMAGRFASETIDGETLRKDWAEYNVRKDIPSAQSLFNAWPTPIVVSGSEIGFTMRVKGSDVASKFNYVRSHPVAMTYRYMDQTYRTDATSSHGLHDHKTFDMTAVLYAVRPNDGYFSLSRPGHVVISPIGVSTFEEQGGGNTRYLVVNDAQRARALEAMTELVSQPPVSGDRDRESGQ